MGPLRKFTPPQARLYFGATSKFYLLWPQALRRQMSLQGGPGIDALCTPKAPQIADGISAPPIRPSCANCSHWINRAGMRDNRPLVIQKQTFVELRLAIKSDQSARSAYERAAVSTNSAVMSPSTAPFASISGHSATGSQMGGAAVADTMVDRMVPVRRQTSMNVSLAIHWYPMARNCASAKPLSSTPARWAQASGTPSLNKLR